MQQSTGTRIDELLKVLNISQLEFANRLGVTTGAITNWKKRKVGMNVINKIVNEFPQVRKSWLIDGTGDAIYREIPYSVTEYKRKSYIDFAAEDTPVYNSHVGVPYYNVEFELGFDMMENDQTTTPSYRIDFKPYNKCDAWCNARGNSMYPTISSGDIIALKCVEDFRFLISGEIYGIVTSNGLRTIKRVRDNGDTMTLIPDNKEYPEQTIDKKDVSKVFQVMGSMKMF